MSLLEEKAQQIAFDSEGTEVFVDPATILSIIGVIIQIVKLYKNCRKSPEEAKYHMDNIGWWNRWRLRRMIRSSIKKNKSASDAEKVYDGVLSHINKTSKEDMDKLYKEVNE